jgi:hypothetical protein
MTASADIETILGGFDASGSLIPKYQRLFTDKLVFRWLEVRGVWSLDSATPATPAYPAHASGSPLAVGWVHLPGSLAMQDLVRFCDTLSLEHVVLESKCVLSAKVWKVIHSMRLSVVVKRLELVDL